MTYGDIEFKANPGQFSIDEAQGIVECFVAGIGNKDSVGDVLIAGAFTESLKRRKPRVVWGHNWNDPIGKVLEIYEVGPGDPRLPEKMKRAGIGGLYAKVQFNLNSEKGREAFANVAFFGHEQEWSIGYKTIDSIHDPGVQANILKEVELYEVSPVLHGANQLTGTISVKSNEASVIDAEKGHGMMGFPHMMGMPGAGMPAKPSVIVIREDDDDKYESEKPIFAEGLAQPISGQQRAKLEKEIMERTGSMVQLIEATENTALFRRMMPNGSAMVFRIGYHTPDNYSTFMFGKPELADGQSRPSMVSGTPSGSRVVVPSQMPMMPMQVKPNYANPEMGVMPKSDDGEKSDLAAQLSDLESILMDEAEAKVGKTINKRNLTKLRSIIESLQEIIATSEKEVETKNYVIPVAIEDAFQTKQLLDPIFDYHRIETEVTEDGIVITSGVTPEFMEAIGVAEKALGRTLGGGMGKLGRAARGAQFFDPNAWDGDGDGLVQEGTPFERPAIPGVNDRSTRGRVDAAAATTAWQQSQSGRGMRSSGKRDEYAVRPKKDRGQNRTIAEMYTEDSGSYDDDLQDWLDANPGKTENDYQKSQEFKDAVDDYENQMADQAERQAERGMRSSGGRLGDPISERERKLVAADRGTVEMFKESRDYERAKDAWRASNPDASDNEFESSMEFSDALVNFDRQLFDHASQVTGFRQHRMQSYQGRPAKVDDIIAISVLQERLRGASLQEVARNHGITPERARSMEAREIARLRNDGNVKDMLAYRIRGLSLDDAAKLFGVTREKARSMEAAEMGRLRSGITDDDISDYRFMGFTVDDLARLSGQPREAIRRRELQIMNERRKNSDRGLASVSRDRGGMASKNIRPDSRVIGAATRLLNEKLEDLDDDPQPGLAGATLDREWAEGVLDGLKDGSISADDAINVIGLAGNAIFDEGKKPEGQRDEAKIESLTKLAKRMRRAVVGNMTSDEMDDYQAERRRRMGADRGMRSAGPSSKFFDDEADFLVADLPATDEDAYKDSPEYEDDLQGWLENNPGKTESDYQKSKEFGDSVEKWVGNMEDQAERRADEIALADAAQRRDMQPDRGMRSVGEPEEADLVKMFDDYESRLGKNVVDAVTAEIDPALKEWRERGMPLKRRSAKEMAQIASVLRILESINQDALDESNGRAISRTRRRLVEELVDGDLLDLIEDSRDMDGVMNAVLEGASAAMVDQAERLGMRPYSRDSKQFIEMQDALYRNLKDDLNKITDQVNKIRRAKRDEEDSRIIDEEDSGDPELITADPKLTRIREAQEEVLRGMASRSGAGSYVTRSSDEVQDSISDDSVLKNPGKSVSDFRRKLAEKLSDDDFIDSIENEEDIEEFVDSLRSYISGTFESVEEKLPRSEKLAFSNLRDDLFEDLDSQLEKMKTSARSLWRERVGSSMRRREMARRWGTRRDEPQNAEEAAKLAAEKRKNLMDHIRSGKDSGPGFEVDDPEDIDEVRDMLEAKLMEIAELDPQGDVEELFNDYVDALREGFKNNPQNPFARYIIQQGYGDYGKITDGDLLQVLSDTRESSEWNPNRGRAARERIRGMASRGGSAREKESRKIDVLGNYVESRKFEEDLYDWLDANPGKTEEDYIKSQDFKDAVDDYDSDLQTAAEQRYDEMRERGMASTLSEANRRRDEGLTPGTGESRPRGAGGSGARSGGEYTPNTQERDAAIIEKLREFGLSDDEISQITGIDNLPEKSDDETLAELESIERGLQSARIDDSETPQSAGRQRRQIEGVKPLGPKPTRGPGTADERARTAIRKFRSESGTVNPHEKIEMQLTNDELGSIVEDLDTLLKNAPGSSVLKSAREKFSKSKSGDKIGFTDKEYEELYKEIEAAKNRGNMISSELASLLDQTVESKDGKYKSPNLGTDGRGMASSGRRPNNGAPTDISEATQRQLIGWARQQRGLILAQRFVNSHDENDGQLSPREWRALETLFANLGPSGGRGMRSESRGSSSPDAIADEQGGRDRGPTALTGRGLGEIGLRGGDEGASERTAPPGPQEQKFTGKSFDEVKPDNWDELSVDEKYDWLFSDGKPGVSGMSEAAYGGVIKAVAMEDEEQEKRNERARRRSDRGMSSRQSSTRNSSPAQMSVDDFITAYQRGGGKRAAWAEDLRGFKDSRSGRGMASRTGRPGKPGRTMVTDEATFFADVEKSLPREIQKATEAKDSRAAAGLRLLQDIIKRQEASKTGSRRTNAGSIFLTADEADSILDGLMWAIDRQLARGGDEERISNLVKMLEKISKAAMSTFVDKDTAEIGSRTQKRRNSQGREVEIPNTGMGIERGMRSSSPWDDRSDEDIQAYVEDLEFEAARERENDERMDEAAQAYAEDAAFEMYRDQERGLPSRSSRGAASRGSRSSSDIARKREEGRKEAQRLVDSWDNADLDFPDVIDAALRHNNIDAGRARTVRALFYGLYGRKDSDAAKPAQDLLNSIDSASIGPMTALALALQKDGVDLSAAEKAYAAAQLLRIIINRREDKKTGR